MPTTSTDQGLTLPEGTDLRDTFPAAMASYNEGVEPRLNARYTSTADRATRHPTLVDGEESFLSDSDKKDVVRGGAWEGLHRALAQPSAAASRITTISIPTGITGVSGYAVTGTAIPLPVEDFDNRALFTASADYMTVPAGETGLYTVEGWAEWDASTTGLRITRINILDSTGTTLIKYREFDKPATGSAATTGSTGPHSWGVWTTPLTAGQRVQLAVKHSAGSALNVTGASLSVTQQAVA